MTAPYLPIGGSKRTQTRSIFKIPMERYENSLLASRIETVEMVTQYDYINGLAKVNGIVEASGSTLNIPLRNVARLYEMMIRYREVEVEYIRCLHMVQDTVRSLTKDCKEASSGPSNQLALKFSCNKHHRKRYYKPEGSMIAEVGGYNGRKSSKARHRCN